MDHSDDGHSCLLLSRLDDYLRTSKRFQNTVDQSPTVKAEISRRLSQLADACSCESTMAAALATSTHDMSYFYLLLNIPSKVAAHSNADSTIPESLVPATYHTMLCRAVCNRLLHAGDGGDALERDPTREFIHVLVRRGHCDDVASAIVHALPSLLRSNHKALSDLFARGSAASEHTSSFGKLLLALVRRLSELTHSIGVESDLRFVVKTIAEHAELLLNSLVSQKQCRSYTAFVWALVAPDAALRSQFDRAVFSAWEQRELLDRAVGHDDWIHVTLGNAVMYALEPLSNDKDDSSNAQRSNEIRNHIGALTSGIHLRLSSPLDAVRRWGGIVGMRMSEVLNVCNSFGDVETLRFPEFEGALETWRGIPLLMSTQKVTSSNDEPSSTSHGGASTAVWRCPPVLGDVEENADDVIDFGEYYGFVSSTLLTDGSSVHNQPKLNPEDIFGAPHKQNDENNNNIIDLTTKQHKNADAKNKALPTTNNAPLSSLLTCLTNASHSGGGEELPFDEYETKFRTLSTVLWSASLSDVASVATSFSEFLLTASNKYALDDFDAWRKDSMTAMATRLPNVVVPYLCSRFFRENYNVPQRYDVLAVLDDAASQLREGYCEAGGEANSSQSVGRTRLANGLPSRVRYPPSRSRSDSRHGAQPIRVNGAVRRPNKRHNSKLSSTPTTNQFANVCDVFVLNLLRSHDTHHFKFITDEPVLCARYVQVLGSFVEKVSNVWSAKIKIWQPVLCFLEAVRLHPNSFVRCHVLRCACVMFEHGVNVDVAASTVEAWLRYCEATATTDDTDMCRVLARAVQSALYVMAHGGRVAPLIQEL